MTEKETLTLKIGELLVVTKGYHTGLIATFKRIASYQTLECDLTLTDRISKISFMGISGVERYNSSAYIMSEINSLKESINKKHC